MEPARLSAWKGSFISSTVTGAAQSILKSEPCTSDLCGKNRIPDMENVLMASARKISVDESLSNIVDNFTILLVTLNRKIAELRCM